MQNSQAFCCLKVRIGFVGFLSSFRYAMNLNSGAIQHLKVRITVPCRRENFVRKFISNGNRFSVENIPAFLLPTIDVNAYKSL